MELLFLLICYLIGYNLNSKPPRGNIRPEPDEDELERRPRKPGGSGSKKKRHKPRDPGYYRE